MPLNEYLKKHNLSAREFARMTGLTHYVIYNAIHYRHVGLIPALKIEFHTDGQVRPLDLVSEGVRNQIATGCEGRA